MQGAEVSSGYKYSFVCTAGLQLQVCAAFPKSQTRCRILPAKTASASGKARNSCLLQACTHLMMSLSPSGPTRAPSFCMVAAPLNIPYEGAVTPCSDSAEV